jgi:hypothetical protein
MDTKKELWNRLENDPDRAYRAFECFLGLSSGERTLLAAYRQHVGNSDAAKPSDTWSGWSNAFAWRERAAAFDAHLASVRREAYERVIEEEAARQAREVEKVRGRYNELLTLSYMQAMEWLENAQPSDFRAQDVIRIIGLHLDYVNTFEVEEPRAEDALQWDDLDLAECTLRVHGTLTSNGIGSVKTSTSRRTVKLPKITVAALRKHHRNGGAFVFSTSKGTSINVCNLRNRVWKPLLVKVSLPTDTHIHALRHSAITLLLSKGVPVKVVSEMAGHADVSITIAVYQSVLPHMQDGAADTMDDALGQPQAHP